MNELAQIIEDRTKSGQRPSRIARDLDLSRGMVYRIADKHGIVVRKGHDRGTHDRGVRFVRECVDDMKPIDAVNFLLEIIETALPSQDFDHIADLRDKVGTTVSESQILAALIQSRGTVVNKDRLLTNLAVGKSVDECPDMKIVDVYICKIRKKLPESVKIKTIWGIGFQLEGNFPWELAA